MTTPAKAAAAISGGGGKPPSGPPKAAAAPSPISTTAAAAAPADSGALAAGVGVSYRFQFVTEEVAREWNKSQVRSLDVTWCGREKMGMGPCRLWR